MKKTLTTLFVFVLPLAFSFTARAQNTNAAASTVKQLRLSLELQDLPGREAEGSFWEVSYQWRIADRRDFDRWSGDGEDPARQNTLGILLSKQTFTRRNLSDPENRRFRISIPVNGELSERLRNAGRRQQIVWLDATVRIHDSKLGTDVVRRVNPVWGPYFYLDGNASLRMELTADGKLRWYTGSAPPWTQGGDHGLSSSRAPSPE
jgi:hypothetical protein